MKSLNSFMQLIYKFLLFSFLLTWISNSYANEESQYRLSSDDVISVIVFDEPELSLKESRVSSSGTISMPLIGQVSVKGLTVNEAESLVTKKYLGDFLKNPDVSISVIEYRQFYVNGEVDEPGGYSYREGMTVERAITLAGGFTERGSRTNIILVREGNTQRIEEVKLNEKVFPGDVITVKESFF